MLISLFVTIAGLVGSGLGLWVAALFVPTLAMLLRAALDFLRSPLGMLLGAMALGLFLFSSGWIGGDVHGSAATRAAWRADVAARARAAAERELALRTDMKAIADRVLTYDDKSSKQLDDEVSSYVAKTPDVACRRATDADVRRLLSIQ